MTSDWQARADHTRRTLLRRCAALAFAVALLLVVAGIWSADVRWYATAGVVLVASVALAAGAHRKEEKR